MGDYPEREKVTGLGAHRAFVFGRGILLEIVLRRQPALTYTSRVVWNPNPTGLPFRTTRPASFIRIAGFHA